METIVAEITNTPWKERHAYVLPVARGQRARRACWQLQFDKEFHVSPFMPMDMRYDWRFTAPGDDLRVHMENWRDGNAGVRRDADRWNAARFGAARWPARCCAFR